jgi:protein CpxP
MTMKNFLVAIGALALTASPAAAQEQGAKDAPKHEHMKDSKMECCKKDEEGKMVCEMMDQNKMEHAKVDHSKMDHGKMDHPGKDAASNDDQHKDHKPE